MILVILAREGSLRTLLACDRVLVGRELLFPLRVGFDNFFSHDGSYPRSLRVERDQRHLRSCDMRPVVTLAAGGRNSEQPCDKSSAFEPHTNFSVIARIAANIPTMEAS